MGFHKRNEELRYYLVKIMKKNNWIEETYGKI